MNKIPSFFTSSLCDSHIHTRLCNHAKGEMEEYVQAGIKKGLKKLIFLEHMEEGIEQAQGKTWLSEDDFDYYFSEGQSLQSRYQGKIEIGLGVECGFNPDYCNLLKARLEKRSWDQIGLSCHFLRLEGVTHHLNLFSRKEVNIQLARKFGAETILDRYFSSLIDAVRCLPGTMLCHLDAALRYLPETILTDSHYAAIDKLLQAVSERGMAVEINTSGFAIRREQFPNQRILDMAQSYGIPFIFGSDAHRPNDVGKNFDIIPHFT
ncbi:MAG: histidinol-phosphatase [Desulforhopalus sp.]